MLGTTCTGGFCHTNGQAAAGLTDLDDFNAGYSNLVNHAATESALKRIEPGNATLSYMMHKLDGTFASPPANGFGSRMPLGKTPLSQEVRDNIRAWINSGAPKN